eukprot:TRINITY_DN2455_c0_g1_i1.p1 TRINITY_DN2455_c0_g1~~TRINITY_DN2455_c0_g1_i1.p1  ORF type:complete len:191 (-),score=33.02 TRINITY_DN2455_c0_g1_i1:79-651(-)
MRINFQMEDYIRFMVEKSMRDYHEFILDACTSEITINGTDKFEVKGDISRKEPLFSLDLLIQQVPGGSETKKNAVVPLTPLDKFKTIPCDLFEKALGLMNNKIPQLETLVMEHLYNRGASIQHVKTVRIEEPLMKRLHTEIGEALDRNLSPIQEYIKCFTKYKKLLNLNVDDYVTKFFVKPKTLSEVRKE